MGILVNSKNRFSYLKLTFIIALLVINPNLIESAKFQAIWYNSNQRIIDNINNGFIMHTKFFDDEPSLNTYDIDTDDDIKIKRTDISNQIVSDNLQNPHIKNFIPSINGNHHRYYLVYEHKELDDDGIYTFALWYYNCEQQANKKYDELSENIFTIKALYSPTEKLLPDKTPIIKGYYDFNNRKATDVCAADPTAEVFINRTISKLYDDLQYNNFEVFTAFSNRDLFYTRLNRLNSKYPIVSCNQYVKIPASSSTPASSPCDQDRNPDTQMIYNVPYSIFIKSKFEDYSDEELIIKNSETNDSDDYNVTKSLFCLESGTIADIDVSKLDNLSVLIFFKNKYEVILG
jgi:hypothetical protein